MKRLFLFMMALALPIFALGMSVEDKNEKTMIPLRMESTTKHVRSLVEEQLVCHYYGVLRSIVTTVSFDMGEINLTVENTSTGEVWYDVFDSGILPQTYLPISGAPGLYLITYTTESGDIYEGTLNLN